jgi:hypothetical protein
VARWEAAAEGDELRVAHEVEEEKRRAIKAINAHENHCSLCVAVPDERDIPVQLARCALGDVLASNLWNLIQLESEPSRWLEVRMLRPEPNPMRAAS